MAEKKAAGTDSEPAQTGGNRKKLLMIVGGAAVAVLVLGVALGWLLLGGKDDGEGEAAEEEVHAPPALYVALGDKFTVTLPGDAKPHYFQVAVSALTRDPAVVEELEFNAPLLRDRLDSLFARQSFEALRTEEGKLALRAEVLRTVQDVVAGTLSEAGGEKGDGDEDEDTKKKPAGGDKEDTGTGTRPGGVEQVFFTEFVLQ